MKRQSDSLKQRESVNGGFWFDFGNYSVDIEKRLEDQSNQELIDLIVKLDSLTKISIKESFESGQRYKAAQIRKALNI